MSYRRALDVAGERLDLPWGVDETLLGALATGARGGVGSTYNWAPGIYRKLMAAFEAGDLFGVEGWHTQATLLFPTGNTTRRQTIL